jgi:hypothetical protein
MNLCIILPFIIISYILYELFCDGGEDCNLCPFTINKTQYFHFHHWMFHLLILVISNKTKKNNEIIDGVNIGGILHGIYNYSDWYVI